MTRDKNPRQKLFISNLQRKFHIDDSFFFKTKVYHLTAS